MEILLTGATGFLGKSIQKSLCCNKIITLSRENAIINFDLSKGIYNGLPKSDIIIHAAGKAHVVPKTELEKQVFFDVNVKGTENLLKGLEQLSVLPRSFVFISSVAVYGLDRGTDISESYNLNAKDPYGLSKVQAEQIVEVWCKENNVICSILRLPLLVGDNPPGNLGAMITAIKKGYYMNVAGGLARKSMVLAEDVAGIISKVAYVGGIYNLTDGFHPNFSELSAHIAQQLNKRKAYNLPSWFVGCLAKTGDLMGSKFPFNSYKLSKMQSDLTFDDSKAREILGWNPNRVLDVFTIK
jgi:nucleoside-diphosphate-sugar epimerase